MARTPTNARERLVQTTRELFRRQGYHATGLNQIVAESHAPKGSLYHYFPGGKEELAVEAVRQAAAELAAQVHAALDGAEDPKTVFDRMGAYIKEKLRSSNFFEACPISTVALETAHESKPLQLACTEAFIAVHGVIQQALLAKGYEPAAADSLATLIQCTYMGSQVLSRTYQNTEPVDTAIEALAMVFPRVKART